jgi:hypothetical protein
MPGGGGRPPGGGGNPPPPRPPLPPPQPPSPPVTQRQFNQLAATVALQFNNCLCVPKPPILGRFVLSSNNGSPEWIPTEEC